MYLSPVNSCFYDPYGNNYYEYACNSKGYNYTTYEDASCLSTPLYSYYTPFNNTCSKVEYSDGYVVYETYSCQTSDLTATPTVAPNTATARAPTATPTVTPTVANSKQWINSYAYSSNNCGGTIQSYSSSSFGFCEQKNDTSSYIAEVLLSNGNLSYTDTVYNTNSQCKGSPSQVVTGTFPQCSNEITSTGLSNGGYSITNSIPSMPAGVLFRYMIIIMYDSNTRII